MAHVSLRRYHVLLRVRRRQEDLKAQSLGEARRTQLALRRERRELEERRRALLTMADTPRGAVVNAVRQHAVFQFDRHVARVIDAKDDEIRKQGERVAATRAELETAMAQRRIMEKLIERAERAERWRQVRREQQELDEHSVIRYAHGGHHRIGTGDDVTDIRDRGPRDHRIFSHGDYLAGR